MKRKTNNKTAKQKEYKSTSARIKALKAAREKAFARFEDSVENVCSCHMKYFAWLHYGKLIRGKLAEDRELDFLYTSVKHMLEESLAMNGQCALDDLKESFERMDEMVELGGSGVPAPVA